MNKFNLIMGICLVSLGVNAQLLDTIAAGSIGAAGATQGVKSVKQGLSMMQQNQIIQNLNRMIMDIKISSPSGYQGLNKNEFQGSPPFGSLDWNVGSVGNDKFFIEIKGLDSSSCRRLADVVRDYITIEINGSVGKNNACSDNSKIKWIFE